MFKLKNKDSHSLSPVEDMPAELEVGTKVLVTSAMGTSTLTITGFGSRRRQAYFKDQAADVKKVFQGASKEAPLEVTLTVV